MRRKVLWFILSESRTPCPPPNKFCVTHCTITQEHDTLIEEDTLIEATNFSVLALNILFIDSRSNPRKSILFKP